MFVDIFNGSHAQNAEILWILVFKQKCDEIYPY